MATKRGKGKSTGKTRRPGTKAASASNTQKALKRRRKLISGDIAEAIRDLRKSLRFSLKILKKAGLISKKTDLRKVKKPTRAQKKAIKEFDAVIRGEAVARKAPKQILQAAQRTGDFKTKGNRIVVPASKGERVTVSSKGITKTRITKAGKKITTKPQMVQPRDLQTWMKKERERLASKKPRGDRYYGFSIYGNRSYRTFMTVDDVLAYMAAYSKKWEEGPDEFLKGLEVIDMTERQRDKWEADANSRKQARKEREKIRARERRQRRYQREKALNPKSQRIKMSDEQKRAKNRARMVQYRKRKKEDRQ